MDPLSIAAACLSIIGAIDKASTAITGFVRTFRKTRQDLTTISKQLTELAMILDLLREENDGAEADGRVPESLKRQILSVLSNCGAILDQLDVGMGCKRP